MVSMVSLKPLRGRKRRENHKIVEEGIITLRRENNEIEGKY